ncbi:TPA: hypothetical protein ACSTJY_003132 [Serratia fonticola]
MNIICALKQQEKLKMKMLFPLFRHTFVTYIGLWLLMSLFVVGQPAKAETITIGKGSGVVWEGMPFNVTLEGAMVSPIFRNDLAIAGISILDDRCTTGFGSTGGIRGYTIAPGVYLNPRINIVGHFTRFDGSQATFSGNVDNTGVNVYMDNGYNMRQRDLCFMPTSGSFTADFYSSSGSRSVNYSGTWVITTDGNQQQTDNVKIPTFYAISHSYNYYSKKSALISPTELTLRISNLECTVNTPTQINFGPVAHDPTTGAELGSLSYPLTTQCSQDSDRVNANINLQFRAISGLYQNSPAQLSLTAGGGYITGEIDNGVTGSGNCTVASGISFNNKPIRIGRITNTQSSLTLANQVTWRLCSGGQELPLGNVDATAEMQVTFN